MNLWTLESAVEACRKLEPLAAECGGHVALTGGCLYKEWTRKDVDIMLYRHKRTKPIDMKRFEQWLALLGVIVTARFRWLMKCHDKAGNCYDFFHFEDLNLSAPDHEYSPTMGASLEHP